MRPCAMTASPMSHGLDSPLPSASLPQVAQALGVNCAGPSAPALLVASSRVVLNLLSW